MSTATLERLRSEILSLSEPERAALANDLINSLSPPEDQEIKEAWDRELIRRIDLINSGKAKLLSRKEFHQKVRDRVGS